MQLADSLNRLGTETAFEVLARAKALEASGRRIIHLQIGEPDFTTPRHIIDAGRKAWADGETHYCPAPGTAGAARGLRRAPLAPPRPRDRSRQRRRRARRQAVPVLRRARDLQPGRRGHLPEPRLPDLRVRDQLGRRDAGAAADHRGPRLRVQRRRPCRAPHAADQARDPQLAGQPDGRHRAARAQRRRWPRLLADHDCWILSDEVYSEMLYDGEHDTIASHEGLLERTILLDGFSKTFAMTGWRLGYAALPKPLVEPITRLIINSVSCTAPAVQLAGVAALEGPRDEVDAMMAEFTKRRDVRRRRAQQAAGRELHRARTARSTPSRTSRRRASTRASSHNRLLDEAGVALLSGTAFGEYGEGYLRRLVRELAREHRGGAGEDGRPARADGRLMAGRIVVTGRVPEPALDLLREAGERRRAHAGDRRCPSTSCTRRSRAPTPS